MPTFTYMQMVFMVGMLVTGSINILCGKAQNEYVAPGYKSPRHSFKHPWVQAWMTCIAMSLCLIGLPFQRRRELEEYTKKQVSKLESEAMEPQIAMDTPVQDKICQWILMIPASINIIVNSLSGIGLLYVDASIFIMMRGSIIIFAGILSKVFLKRDIKPSQWLGIILVTTGLFLAGCSSVFKNQRYMTNGGGSLLGISMILVSQVVSSGQMIFEEVLLKRRNLHPLHVVGMMGIFSFLLTTFIVLPVLYFIPGDDVHNSYENSLDALYQIYNSSTLLILCLLYIGSVGLYSYFAFSVIKALTTVHRTLIDACRTIVVWGVGIVIYYMFDKDFGEPFDTSYGLLQVDGFLFIVFGTAMFNQLIDFWDFVSICTCTSKKDNSI